MSKHVLMAMAVTVGLMAGSSAGFAQSYKGNGTSAVPGPSNNLNNPQSQANMAGQPSNAHTVPSSGDAKKIPTPVITGSPMSSVPKPLGVPSSGVVR